VSKEIEKQFKKLGVKVLTGTKVESIADESTRHRPFSSFSSMSSCAPSAA
jgi:phytoene dehydrogenase-like protein